MSKKIVLIALVVFLGGFYSLIRMTAKMDRVDSFYPDSGQLTDSAFSWFPFEKRLLDRAKDISLVTDVDVNKYVIRWKYLEPASMNILREGLLKMSNGNETVNCNGSTRAECQAMKKKDGILLIFEIPPRGAHGESIWLLDFDGLSVFGASEIPVPWYLE